MTQGAAMGAEVIREERNAGVGPEVDVSALLKRTRGEKGLSLRDVELATRIPAHYVQLLEGEGDARLLADALYLIPFLRTYSVFLDLDPAETVALFIVGVQRKEAVQPPEAPAPLRPSLSRTTLIVLAGLAVLALLWAMT